MLSLEFCCAFKGHPLLVINAFGSDAALYHYHLRNDECHYDSQAERCYSDDADELLDHGRASLTTSSPFAPIFGALVDLRSVNDRQVSQTQL